MNATSDASIDGIVLCGGQSRRMGMPKALLPFGDEPMLARVVRLLRSAVREIVVVAAPGQELPPLDSSVRVVRDRRQDRGPLEGLAAGLSALAADSQGAYVTGCDVPLLVPDFIRRIITLLGEHEAAVPRIDERFQPLAAVYRAGVLATIQQLLAADRLRVFDLFSLIHTRVVSADELIDVDPRLCSLRNLNTRDDYLAALVEAGLSIPVGLEKDRKNQTRDRSPGGE